MGIGQERYITRIFEEYIEDGAAWVARGLNAERREGCCPEWETDPIRSLLGQLGRVGRQEPSIGADVDQDEEG